MSRDKLDLLEVKDSQWIRQAFFRRGLGGAGGGYDAKMKKSSLNFYDTTLGGNRAINPHPQFTRYSDIKNESIAYNSAGMGDYYEEAVEKNEQRISLQFGVPEFNSLTAFMSSFYNRDAGQLVHFGEVSTASKIGYALGVIFTLPVQAYFGINYLYNKVAATITGNPYSKFYYMRPTMPIYWNAVTILFNQLAAEMGMEVGNISNDIKVTDGKVEYKEQADATMGLIKELMPDVIRGDGSSSTIDVKSISSRSQRLANAFEDTMNRILDNANSKEDVVAAIAQLTNSKARIKRTSALFPNMPDYLKRFSQSPLGDGLDNPQAVPEVDGAGNPISTPATGVPKDAARGVRTREAGIKDYLLAELRDGSAFVTFNVENEGPVSASFSNSTKAPGIKETANAASSSAKDATVNMAGGNVGDNFLLNAAEGAVSMVKDVIGGAASSVGLQGIGALAGAAYLEMPDVVDDSTAELPATQYKMRLATPYGNRYSILTRIYLPLCMILAGALPRKTGPSSYGPPFLCRLHSQGRNEIKLGVIDSLSIEIGTSNIDRNRDGLPTAIDVSFSIKNLDSIMSVPVADSLSDDLIGFSAFGEDSTIGDFLTSLAGVSLSDQYYAGARVKRAFARTAKTWGSFTSPSYFAQWFAGSATGGVLSAFMTAGDI